MVDDLRYCKYYENFMVSTSLPNRVTESWRDHAGTWSADVCVSETGGCQTDLRNQ